MRLLFDETIALCYRDKLPFIWPWSGYRSQKDTVPALEVLVKTKQGWYRYWTIANGYRHVIENGIEYQLYTPPERINLWHETIREEVHEFLPTIDPRTGEPRDFS